MGYWRVGTTYYWLNSFPGCDSFGSCCTAPNCTYFTANNGQINTSDYAAGLWVYIQNAADGESFTFDGVAPDGSVWGGAVLTYNQQKQCFNWSNASTSAATNAPPPSLCGNNCNKDMCLGNQVYAWAGPNMPCYISNASLAGNWTLEVFDSANPANPAVTHNFSLQHNGSSQLGITSPVPSTMLDNALIDLASDQNYTGTDASSCDPIPVNPQGNPTAVCFSAATSNGNSINWQLQLKYATSGGYGQIYDPNGSPLTFTTSSGQMQNHVYQNEGGQLANILVNTTASDGSFVQDCTNAYIEGPQGGIPNSTITGQLEQSPQSYPMSSSFPSGGTSSLMAQVAVKESSYTQFRRPDEGNANLYPGVDGKWPLENGVGGQNIGLMMVETDPNQASDPDAWNWLTNTADGVNLFSGTPPAEYQDGENKIQHATDFETEMRNNFTPTPPAMTGQQLENMALILYGPYAHLTDPTLTLQYYIPTCTATKKGKCIASGWAVNSGTGGNPNGVNYANSVRAQTVPQ